MKFFDNHITTPVSNCQQGNWVYPCGVQDTLEPSHWSSFRYSKHHNQLPKNAGPNTVYPTTGILVAKDGKYDPSSVSLNYLHSKMEGIQYEGERDLCSQHLSKFAHSLNCKSELSNLYNAVEYRQLIHDNDTSLSKPSERLSEIRYVNYAYTLSWVQRYEKFIETESSRTESAGF